MSNAGAGQGAERTQFRPQPGGRRRNPAFMGGGDGGQTVPPSQGQVPRSQQNQQTPSFEELRGLEPDSISKNPILAAASTLLTLTRQLRNTPSHPDVPGLRITTLQAIKAFEIDARNREVSAQEINSARYILCSLIDETVLNTPWGGNSIWNTDSLLNTIYSEATGGEKVFQILAYLSREPAQNIDLLEFIYICLSIGFMGRFAVIDNGAQQLQSVREGLYQTIRSIRGDRRSELSPRWQGVQDRRATVARLVPLWVAIAGCAVLVTLLFFVFRLLLSNDSDVVYKRLAAIGEQTSASGSGQNLVEPAAGQNVPQVVQTLKQELAAPIGAGEVQVEAGTAGQAGTAANQTEGGSSTAGVGKGVTAAAALDSKTVQILNAGNYARIVLRSPDLFASASDRLNPSYESVMQTLAKALADEKTPIIVSGHTDSLPIHTVRYPSNWALSEARAKSVVAALEKYGGPESIGRYIAEGRADTQPIASNATPEGRALNRRVEIDVPVY